MKAWLCSVLLLLMPLCSIADQVVGEHLDDQLKVFAAEKLIAEGERQSREYMSFLNEPSMSMGLYRLAAGASDEQNPHSRDEIYYVVNGTATLVAGDETLELSPGSTAFVRANVTHRFIDIAEDLDVLVIFVAAPSNPADPEALAFAAADVRPAANPDENDWNPFVDVSTLKFGLYSLPEALGGDEPLTHEIDEVNIVVKGNANFVVGNESVAVAPGSIMYVRSGNAHAFKNLSEDFEVLILFAMAE